MAEAVVRVGSSWVLSQVAILLVYLAANLVAVQVAIPAVALAVEAAPGEVAAGPVSPALAVRDLFCRA